MQKSAFRDKDNTFTQTLAYGVTDDIELRIADDYALDHNKTYNNTGGGTGVTDEGLTDPTFGVTWRVLDEKQFPINFYLEANYTPNWIPAKSGTVSTSGSVARGGQVVSFGPAASYETKSLTIAGSFLANYYGDRTSLNQNSNVETEVDNSWAYVATLASQLRFTDQWSLNMSAAETFNNGYDASFTNTGGALESYSADSRDTTSLTAGVNYQFIPNRVAGTLFYQLNMYENQNINYASPFAASGGETRNEYENLFGARLSYVFN